MYLATAVKDILPILQIWSRPAQAATFDSHDPRQRGGGAEARMRTPGENCHISCVRTSAFGANRVHRTPHDRCVTGETPHTTDRRQLACEMQSTSPEQAGPCWLGTHVSAPETRGALGATSRCTPLLPHLRGKSAVCVKCDVCAFHRWLSWGLIVVIAWYSRCGVSWRVSTQEAWCASCLTPLRAIISQHLDWNMRTAKAARCGCRCWRFRTCNAHAKTITVIDWNTKYVLCSDDVGMFTPLLRAQIVHLAATLCLSGWTRACCSAGKLD